MVIKFKCECGNDQVDQTVEYDGWLGYEAIICTVCGRIHDHNGIHLPDEWSSQYIEEIYE